MIYSRIVSPEEIGWIHDIAGFYQTTGSPRVWRKPDGTLYEFPPGIPMVVAVARHDLFGSEGDRA